MSIDNQIVLEEAEIRFLYSDAWGYMTNRNAINITFVSILIGYIAFSLQPKAPDVGIRPPVDIPIETKKCAVLSNGIHYNGSLCQMSKADYRK
jgi:hypothetical protein